MSQLLDTEQRLHGLRIASRTNRTSAARASVSAATPILCQTIFRTVRVRGVGLDARAAKAYCLASNDLHSIGATAMTNQLSSANMFGESVYWA